MAVLGGGKESLLPSLTHSHVKTYRSSAVVWWSISVLGKCTAFIYSGEYEIRGTHSRPISIVSTLQIALLNIHYDSANHFYPSKTHFYSDIYKYILQVCDHWQFTFQQFWYMCFCHMFPPMTGVLFFFFHRHSALTHMLMVMYNVEQWRVFVCD